ncbi:MAG: transporter transrane protein [Firmicutes bacterium]|nr:transporter transrane protein [Bacillota bacterium]
MTNVSTEFPKFRWVILAVLCITQVCSSTILISIAPLMGVIAKDLGIDLGTASFSFMGLHFLATAISCIISGFLIDRFGLYKVLGGSLTVMAIANASLPFVGTTYEGVLAIRIIEGFSCAACVVAIGPVVATWFPNHEKGTANGLQSVAISLGIAAALVASPALVNAVGYWQGGVAWLSVLPILALMLNIWVAVAPHPEPPAQAGPNGSVVSDDDQIFKKALRKRGFWIGALAYCCGLWTQQAFNDLMPSYFAVEQPIGVGFGPLVAGKIMTTVMFAGIAGSLVVGILLDRVFKGKARPIVLIGFALLAICCTSVMFPQVYGNWGTLLLSLVMVGIGTPFINPVVLAFAASSFPSSIVGRVVGIWTGVGLFFGALGVIIGAGALHATGTYHLSIMIVGMVAVVGFLIAIFMKKPQFRAA